jgi:hypothetical protein
MLRQIIFPSEQNFTLQLPMEMVGKTIEVIAFEIDETKIRKTDTTKAKRVKAIEAITKNSLVDLSNFKFNRQEANNYDE